MHIVDLSVKRPIMILMGVIALVIFGFAAYFTIPISLLPNVKIPYVSIQTVYPGASPEVIETQITKKIEDQISSIGDLESITSYSMDNASIVLVEFAYGKDENIALQEVKDKVEVIISDFPSDAHRPSMSKLDVATVMPIMNIVLEGDMEPTELYDYASNEVQDKLSQVGGVGSVDLAGGREREIRVELNRTTVFSHGISLPQISGILAAANIEIPGGNLQYNSRDIPVRLKGEFTSLDEIRNLDVQTRTGVFKLYQLADVRDGGKDVRERTILFDKTAGINNENAILLKIIKNPTANTVTVVDEITEKIKEIEKESGGRVKLFVVYEDGTFVRDSVSDTMMNIYLGILFTGLVLLFFLHDLRSTLIVILAMPFSVFSTFLVMKGLGIGLNMVSLLGLSSSIGTLVANSVVVLENIFRHKELRHGRQESAALGAKEVTIAVFASTLTNVAVFIPLGAVPGILGPMLANFAYTIVIATVFSFIVSFTLTPMMASRILPVTVKREGGLSRGLETMFSRWEDFYEGMLGSILKNKIRSSALVGIVLVLFLGSIVMARFMTFELFPQTDGGKLQVSIELPRGNDLESTAMVAAEIEKRLAKDARVKTLLTTIGTMGGTMGGMNQDVSVAQMTVLLVPKTERTENNALVATDFTRMLSDIPGATIRVSPLSEIQVSGMLVAIDLYLQGNDLNVLQQEAENLKDIINSIPGITNTALSSESGKTEVVFYPKRKQIAEDGLTVQAIAATLRSSIDGFVAGTYKEGGDEYDVRVTIQDTAITDLEDLKNIPVAASAGVYPLSRYADIALAEGSTKIMRNNKERTIEITADVLPGYAGGNVLGEVMAAIGEYDLSPGYKVTQSASTEMFTDTIKGLIVAFLIAIVLIYMLLAAILESLTQPLFILSTVPLALMGVIVILLATGIVLNVVSMIGIIMLVGIVVNNAILILDYYNQQKNQGVDIRKAMLTACRLKLKPILMSNLAIVLGMLPMALGLGASGAELRQPMGVVIIGGIISAMILTLFLLPSLEFLVSRRSGKESTATFAEDRK